VREGTGRWLGGELVGRWSGLDQQVLTGPGAHVHGKVVWCDGVQRGCDVAWMPTATGVCLHEGEDVFAADCEPGGYRVARRGS
jgi:hypothetical protein